MNIKEQIGQRIQEARKAKGLTQAALAERAGNLTQPRINNWERGLRTPGLEEIKLVGQVLDVSPAWLMSLTDNKTSHLEQPQTNILLVPLLDHQCESVHKNTGYNKSISFVPIVRDVAENMGNNLFALKIKDASMEHDLLINDVIIVSPDIAPMPGNLVVAKIENDQEVFIRRYKLLSASNIAKEFELLAMNKHWPDIKNPEGGKCIILGTVIYLQRNLL